MKTFRTNSFRLKYNSYQHAYFVTVSKRYIFCLKLLTEWIFYQLKDGYSKNYVKKLDYDFKRYNYSNIDDFPTRLFLYQYRKIPSSIAQNIFPEAMELVMSRIKKPQKEFHFKLHYRGFTWTNIQSKKRNLVLPRSKYLKQYFKDPVTVTIPESVFNHVNAETDKWYLRFRFKNGMWMVYIVKTLKMDRKKTDTRTFLSIDIGLNDISLIDEVSKQPLLLSLKQTTYKALKMYQRYSKYQGLGNVLKARKYRNRIVNCYRNVLKLYAIRIVQWAHRNQINRIVIGNVRSYIKKKHLNRNVRKLWNIVPWSFFIEYLKHYSQRFNILCYKVNESYTSQASSLHSDELPNNKFEKESKKITFSGTRLTRGLYKCKGGVVINSDVNGAANILRRAASRFGKKISFTKHQLSAVRRVGYQLLNSFPLHLCLEIKKIKDYMDIPGNIFHFVRIYKEQLLLNRSPKSRNLSLIPLDF